MDRDVWLEQRRSSLGASDAPAVCCLSPWRTPLDVYLEKIGQAPSESESLQAYIGRVMEPAIAAIYERQTGLALRPPSEPIVYHPERKWQHASLDRVREDGRVVELKTAGGKMAKLWGTEDDAVPDPYLIQLTHQMMVTGADQADIAVLIGGTDFRVYTVPFNRHLADTVLAMEEEFWVRVEQRHPPDPDWDNARTPKLVNALHVPQPGVRVELGLEAVVPVASFLEAKDTIERTAAYAEGLKARIIEMMGPASEAVLPDGTLLTRKAVKIKEHARRETTRYEFRIKGPMKED